MGVPLNDLFQSLLDGQEIAIEPVLEPEAKSLVRDAQNIGQISQTINAVWV